MFNTILTNNELAKEKSSEIWSEWLMFESNASDLKQITSVIEKRNQTYEEINQLDERQTQLIVDRYKFMNLYPCSVSELKLLGYKDRNLVSSSSSALTTSQIASTSSNNLNSLISDESTKVQHEKAYDLNSYNPFSRLASRKSSRYPVPDVNKMFPFKPNRNAFSGLQPVPGGGMFLFPSCFAEMIKRLPPPSCFEVKFYLLY